MSLLPCVVYSAMMSPSAPAEPRLYGRIPMSSLKRLLGLSLIIATAILITSPAVMRGQTREAKPKATGSISGHVLLNGKAVAGIAVAAYGGEAMSRRVAAA